MPPAAPKGQPANTGTPHNPSSAPANQNASGNGEQAPKKGKKKNKKRKKNNAGGNGSQPSGGQQSAPQNGQSASGASGSQQPKQKPANKPVKTNKPQHNKIPDVDALALARRAKPPTPPPQPVFTKFTGLPLEIQKRIFEIAYRLTDSGRLYKWTYISRQVREW